MIALSSPLKLGILLMPLVLIQSVFASTAPVINDFSANESLVTPGTDVTLSWVVSDADEIYLNGTLFAVSYTHLTLPTTSRV